MDGQVPNGASVPQLRRTAGGAQFLIDGTPRLLLAGQAHNSSPSGEQYFTAVCEHVAEMNVQTLLVGISWSSTEPVEGTADFTNLDMLLTQARAHHLQLVLLWFGAYKNAGSTYAPTWVRADTTRFPRAVQHPTARALFTYQDEMPKPVLSVFSPELRQVEQRAFAAMLQHLEREDRDHTVVMVQVENESGIVRDSRDRSAAAQQAWEAEVPPRLLEHLTRQAHRIRPELAALWSRQGRRAAGTWAEVFGDDWEAEEVFMAWGFASHAETLAAAGKAQKPLPMYANAWLGPQAGQPRAGDYPSGGPASRVLDVWKAAAPSLDLLAPDIYVPDVKSVLIDYARDDNPLFVPEAQFRTGSLFYALGHHRAIGFSVFGIEDGRVDSQLATAYALLSPMQDLIASAQAENRIEGILLDENQPQATFSLGGYDITAQGSRDLIGSMLLDAGVPVPPPPPPAPSEVAGAGIPPQPADQRPFGLIIEMGPDEFLLVGQGVTVNFSQPSSLVELDQATEGHFEGGTWRPGRVLNGDERLYLVPPDNLGAVQIRLLRTDVA
ncbi:MAG TPA: DUF5597 domain-containing protein [Mycobacterium sp.]